MTVWTYVYGAFGFILIGVSSVLFLFCSVSSGRQKASGGDQLTWIERKFYWVPLSIAIALLLQAIATIDW